MTPDQQPDPARLRFAVIAGLRLTSASIIVAGIVVLFSPMVTFDDGTRKIVGLGLVAIGLLEMLVVIPMFVRRWRTPPGGPTS